MSVLKSQNNKFAPNMRRDNALGYSMNSEFDKFSKDLRTDKKKAVFSAA